MNLYDHYMDGATIPVLDAHGHLGSFPGIYMPEAPLEKMIEGMDRCGIEALFISPHRAILGDTREGNTEMLDAIAQYPKRLYGYCTINPNFPDDIEHELSRCMDVTGVIGIKIHPGTHARNVNDPAYAPVWERAHHNKWMVLSHTWGEGGGCGATDLRPIAEQYPEVRLLLGHSCYGAWDRACALAADFPNVYLELTAAYHVYGLIERMCAVAGSHKVLFGTDYPWFDPMVAIGCVASARITQKAMHNILYNNARRLLDEQCDR